MKLVFFSFAFVFLLMFKPWTKMYSNESFEAKSDSKIKSVDDSLITIVAVGDIMMGSNYPSEAYLPPRDLNLLDPVSTFIQAADVAFGNLEGTVLDQGGKIKNCSDPSKCYAFRQPTYFVEQLKNAGFDFLSVANNHMGDFGDEGRVNTQRVLKEAGIRYAGLEACPWDTLTVKGVKIGMVAVAPNNGCIKINDYQRIKELIGKLNDMCGIVILSFHGGAEGSSKTHITRQTEMFYGENRGNVYEMARVAIDAGADVVLGHGPHVTRAIDCYKDRFITYSMGNFCTYRQFNLKGVSGVAPLFELTLRKDGSIKQGKVISIKQLGEGGPVVDSLHGAWEQIKSLTKTDLPELGVQFTADQTFFFN